MMRDVEGKEEAQKSGEEMHPDANEQQPRHRRRRTHAQRTHSRSNMAGK